MCGIVGYAGRREAREILVEGLRRLEYRGYDSAGVAIQNGRGIVTRKVAGRVTQLASLIGQRPMLGVSGIAHTRWATHGAPTERNAHPHTDCSGRIALVHNGMIENCAALRSLLRDSGHTFRTDTDSEVLAHLIEASREPTLEARVADALRWVDGTYGLAVLSAAEPGKMVVARKGSPVLVGLGDQEFHIASDPSALLPHTRSFVHLKDGDVAVITAEGYRVMDGELKLHARSVDETAWAPGVTERTGHPHFMLKEIFDQPATVRDTLRGRLQVDEGGTRLNGLRLGDAECYALEHIVIVGCGTSWHAGLVGRTIIEQLSGLPVRVEYASEYCAQPRLHLPNTLMIAMSQSGETADTLEAMRAGRDAGARVVGLVNVVGSAIAREADGGVYLHAGPEIGAASTKAFTSQVAALALIGLRIARARGLAAGRAQAIVHELQRIPELLSRTLELEPRAREAAAVCANATWAYCLGRGVSYPVALEGALKLKEISLLHAAALPAGELGHGHLAPIREHTPVLFVAPRDYVHGRVLAGIREVKRRGAGAIVVATEGDGELNRLADHVFEVPATDPLLTPLLTVVPLQLLAYHTAVLRGCRVDHPGLSASACQ